MVGERLGQLGHPLFKDRSTNNYLALVTCDCATTGTWRPRLPIVVRQRRIDHLNRSRHSNLSVHRLEPMEEGSSKRILLQFLTLAALLVGVKDETSVIDTSN